MLRVSPLGGLGAFTAEVADLRYVGRGNLVVGMPPLENLSEPREYAPGERLLERQALQALIDHSQQYVNGEVRLKLYKGNITVVGRQSDDTLYDSAIVTFEDDAGAYDQADASGFIRLNALRLRVAASKGRKHR